MQSIWSVVHKINQRCVDDGSFYHVLNEEYVIFEKMDGKQKKNMKKTGKLITIKEKDNTTGCLNKQTCHFAFYYNYCPSWLISIIFAPLETVTNTQQPLVVYSHNGLMTSQL